MPESLIPGVQSSFPNTSRGHDERTSEVGNERASNGLPIHLTDPKLEKFIFGDIEDSDIRKAFLTPKLLETWGIELSNGRLPIIEDKDGNHRKAESVSEFQEYVYALQAKNRLEKEQAKKKRT
jgi:hypothetical protein